MPKKETDKKPETDKISDKDKAVNDTLDEIRGRFGEGSIMRLGEAKALNVDFISTGSVSLDIALLPVRQPL